MKPSAWIAVVGVTHALANVHGQVKRDNGYRTYVTDVPVYEPSTDVYETICTTTEYSTSPHTYYETTTEYVDKTKKITKVYTKTEVKKYTSTSIYTTITTDVVTKTKYKPTTVYLTATETEVSVSVSRELSISTSISTDVQPTTEVRVVTLSASTVTEDGETITLAPQTITTTVVNNIPVTISDTVIQTQVIEGPTVENTVVQVSTETLPAQTITSTVTSVESGTTVLSTTVLTLPGEIIQNTVVQDFTETLPAQTITSTVTSVESGTTVLSITVSTLPGEVIQNTVVQTLPRETILSTIFDTEETTMVDMAPAQIVTVEVPFTITAPAPDPVTITATPAAPACPPNGGLPTANALGCQGRNCSLEFQEDAAVHWAPAATSLPPLVTAITFIDPTASATCITTICNTQAFNDYYRQTYTNCANPPCPTNTIDCNCDIVVGPINLPDGSTTSVTQVGPSGWNLILGATPTGRDLGRCGSAGGECITATSTTLQTNLVYTGDVIPPVTGAMESRYLLPGLTDYFEPGNPFGDCTTATLRTVSYVDTPMILKRQAGGPDSKLFTWTGTPSLTSQLTKIAAQALEAPTLAPSASAQPTSVASTDDSPPPPPAPTTEQSPPDTPTTQSLTPGAVTERTRSFPAVPSPSGAPGVISTGTMLQDASTTAGAAPDGGSSTASAVATIPDSVPPNMETITQTDSMSYSMLLSPEQSSILEAYSSLETALSTATGDIRSYVSSVLGFGANATSASGAGDSTSTSSTPISTGNAAPTEGMPGSLVALLSLLLGFAI